MDEVIYLLQAKNLTNDIGDPIKTLEKKKRFAEKLEIGQREFYQAAAN